MRIDFTPLEHKGPLVIDFTPRIFLCKTHSYILVKTGTKYGHFLTMESGSIELVKLEMGADGRFYFRKRNEGEVGDKTQAFVEYPLVPYHKTSMESALKVYLTSPLNRTVKAARALAELTGGVLPPEEQETPARAKRKPKSGDSRPHTTLPGYTLHELCEELGIDPTEARAELRAKGVKKPGSKWSWENREQAKEAIKALKR